MCDGLHSHTHKKAADSCEYSGWIRSEKRLFQTHFRSAGVALQTFAIGEFCGNLAQHLGTGFAHFNDGAALLEVIHPSGEEKRAVPLVGSTWLGPAQ